MSEFQPERFKPEHPAPPPFEEMPEFGENVFEVSESGELKLVSPDIKIEKPAEGKKEIPANILEDAENYAKMMADIARDPKEAGRISEEAYKKFLKEKGY